MISIAEYAEHLLGSRVWLSSVKAATFLPGFVEPPHVIMQSRLLLIAGGRLDYIVEGDRISVEAGQMIFVPRLVSRQWLVPSDVTSGCRLHWFIFDTDPPEPLGVPEMLGEPEDVGWETAAFMAMAQRAQRQPVNCPANQADTVAAMVRFLAGARPVRSERQDGRAHRSQHAVRQVAQWLAENFANPDALHGLHRRAHLSENYFREVFRQELGMNPRWYLRTLRMQAARFRLYERRMTVKEAAAAVGYEDPFYFSRHYRRYWGHPPTDDRPGAG